MSFLRQRVARAKLEQYVSQNNNSEAATDTQYCMHSQLKSEKNANFFNWKFCNIRCGGGGSHMCTLWCAIKRQTGNFFLLMKANGKYQSKSKAHTENLKSRKISESTGKDFSLKIQMEVRKLLSSRRYGRGLYGCYVYASWRWCLAFFGVLSFSVSLSHPLWLMSMKVFIRSGKKVVCMLALRCLCSHNTRRHEGAAERSVYRITNISIKANFPRELSHM